MKKAAAIVFTLVQLCMLLAPVCGAGQIIKSIVYDFDGFDAGAQDLPEGDYSYGDLSYAVSSQPLIPSEVLGDRALKMKLSWTSGYGAFGRGVSKYIELNRTADRLNFFFYNPPANNQPAELVLSLADDDNQDHTYTISDDDNWKASLSIPVGSSWQLISVPLSSFSDSNPGGNGVFDIAYSQNKGMLLLVEFRFNKPAGPQNDPTFYIDMISFSEGAFPAGSNLLGLPASQSGDYCLLGAHQAENPGEFYLIPQKFEALFTVQSRKIRYVNTYMRWATNGSTVPHMLPGTGYQTLLNNGYRPIITWEPSFSGFAPLDAVQPRLSNIVNGDYNAYIDAFADKVKSYSDTIIIRLMHEFDGDWYAWCISQNNNDPALFAAAYRAVVDRFKAKNVKNVLWMWCPNSAPSPYRHWNWMVSAYPGDSYVDIVATDVYNAHYPANTPWWRSFRWLTAESYYYAAKYFPNKPFFICELASRERSTAELSGSQTKAQWIAAMDLDLQSYFRKTRAIVFFSENKTQDWRVNSSDQALQSLSSNIWTDDYYFPGFAPTGLPDQKAGDFTLFPNPAGETTSIRNSSQEEHSVCIISGTGQELKRLALPPGDTRLETAVLPEGLYFLIVHENGNRRVFRLLVARK